jgi:hypothetical protein
MIKRTAIPLVASACIVGIGIWGLGEHSGQSLSVSELAIPSMYARQYCHKLCDYPAAAEISR